MVHVRLLSPASSPSPIQAVKERRERARHQSSDDLIEDLEHHLGNTLTEYLQVRMSYRHSAFPHLQDNRPPHRAQDGVTDIDTTLVTTAFAVIQRHNPLSPWSPHPSVQPNPIFEIVASHWGPESASGIMHRVLGSRTPSRRSQNPRPSMPFPNLAAALQLPDDRLP